MSTNPYEVTPRIWNEWHELLKEKLRCEATKALALEIGRTGIVMGACMVFAALAALMSEGGNWRIALARLAWAAGITIVGLAISYPLYRPVRARLNEIELLLPTASESETIAAEDEFDSDYAVEQAAQMESTDDEA